LQSHHSQARDHDPGESQGRPARRRKDGHARQSGTLHDRRLAVARLHQEEAAKILFKDIAPAFKDRQGGYTRIIRMNQRNGDAAQRAILEWVDFVAEAPAAPKRPLPPRPSPKRKSNFV